MAEPGPANGGIASSAQVDCYRSFAGLAENEREGIDYRIAVVERSDSDTAVIAPHGGSIERRTSTIARAIAGGESNLYLFEGLDEAGSFDTLHITSHRFDEPRCLRLISRCMRVIAVHGCSGKRPRVMLGGLDRSLIAELAGALSPLDILVLDRGHPYPGTHPRNICNRGASAQGVQIELSDGLRGAAAEAAVVGSIRRVLTQPARATQCGDVTLGPR